MRYCFGDYVLDTQRAELHGAGAPIKLRRKVFQVLAYLLAHHDRVVPKQELLEHLWPEQFVGDEALKACMKTLRQALGERGRTPRFVRTLHGQGYRFVAPVAVQEPLPAEPRHRPALAPPLAAAPGRGTGASAGPIAPGQYPGGGTQTGHRAVWGPGRGAHPGGAPGAGGDVPPDV